MGYLPIFVALSGLVLLYSLYTKNQIIPKKTALILVIDQMAKLSSERKNLILTYDRANDNSVLNEVASDLMKTDRFQTFRIENELITKTNAAASNLSEEDKDLKTQILELNQKQEEQLKQLALRAGQYNRFIKKAPTKFIASLFGYKSF